MISSMVKLTVSEFVFQILQNDALKFDFLRSKGKPNINGILNKLLPNLVYYRKFRRQEIYDILQNEFARDDAEKVYECVNTVIDKVYFSDAELDSLEETIWFRPSQKKKTPFDEIEESESKITAQNPSAYIRGLLNEYCRLPQYKREQLLFDDELREYSEACETGKIFHACINGRSVRIFAFHYVYEYTYDQGNYLIGYNLSDKIIEAIPLYKIQNFYTVQKKYRPSDRLIEVLQKYYEDHQYENRITYDEGEL